MQTTIPLPFTHHHITAFRSHALGNTRPVEIFLPPDYVNHSAQRPRVLVLNDGQDAQAIGLAHTLAHQYANRQIEPLIVIAVHTTHDRLQEYGTIGVVNALGLGRRADAYRQFLLEELLPVLYQRYGLEPTARDTAIAGFSLGGLMAFDLAWSYPQHFGAVGVFSGSFWWRTDDRSVSAKLRSRIMHRKVRTSRTLPRLRFWLQAGTEDETSDRDGDGVIDAIQDTTELIDTLVQRGYQRGQDLVYREVVGGHHDQITWGRVLPEFLVWLCQPGACEE